MLANVAAPVREICDQPVDMLRRSHWITSLEFLSLIGHRKISRMIVVRCDKLTRSFPDTLAAAANRGSLR